MERRIEQMESDVDVLYLGDCLDVLPTLDADSVDAVVTDPPYHLTSINKRYSSAEAMETKHPVYKRHTRGFMGKGWDGGNVAFRPETWREVYRVLKPGGHMLAMGGTRTYHRLVCAVEDAGFEIRDCIAWLYGSGFPKSFNMGGGWGTALKPAMELIVVARKPLSEKSVAANVARYGTGAVNVDACRIEGVVPQVMQGAQDRVHGNGKGLRSEQTRSRPHEAGRWPANVVLDEEAAGMLGQSRIGNPRGAASGHGWGMTATGAEYEDGDGASRFFYTSKASSAERLGPNRTRSQSEHPTVKPISLMAWLVRLVTPPNGVVLDPFLGSGTTAMACAGNGFHYIGIERDAQYVEIARQRIGFGARVVEHGS